MQHLLSFFKAPNFSAYVTQFSYLGVFVWFTIFDFVAPVPDELSLLTVGYFASTGALNPFFAGAIIAFSFLLTDTISFYLVRGGKSLFGHKFKEPKRNSFRGWVRRHLERNLPGTLIAICFIPRMRVWGPLVAGSTKIKFGRFVLFDAIGVVLFVSVYTTLGYFFGQSFTAIFSVHKGAAIAFLAGALVVIGGVLAFTYFKIRSEKGHD